MAVIDVVLVVVLLAALLSGLRAGFFSGLGWLLGLVSAGALLPFVLPRVSAYLTGSDWRGIAVLATGLVLLLVGAGVGSALGSNLRRGVEDTPLGGVERLLGGVLGLVVGVAVVSLLGSGVKSAGIPGISAAVASSTVLRTIEEYTPDPVARVLARIEAGVRDDALPVLGDVLAGGVLGPGAAPAPEALDIADPDLERSAASVARITGTAWRCSTASNGSGFVVAEDRVVTNAHVVAGVEDTVVELPGETARSGEVIYYDAGADLAVIAVDVDAPPLPVVEPLPAGTPAAVQGYPYGGPFSTVPAAVVGLGEAALPGLEDGGGDGVVVSGGLGGGNVLEIYRLQTEVVPGNSGGPLLTEAGEVAGVVFARDDERADIAYALSSTVLLAALEALGDAQAPVDTGDCAQRPEPVAP